MAERPFIVKNNRKGWRNTARSLLRRMKTGFDSAFETGEVQTAAGLAAMCLGAHSDNRLLLATGAVTFMRGWRASHRSLMRGTKTTTPSNGW